VAQHPLAAPRIALVHTWVNTQDEGWYRVEFDRLGIPYDYISDQVIARTPNLREKWDVIIFAPARGSAQSIVRGVAKRGENEAPIPWKKSDLTPNFGLAPDQTDDIRGGMGLQGVANLQGFIEAGGLFVAIGSNAAVPIDYGVIEGVTIQEARRLQARGSVFSANFADRKSPISYGYDENLAVYFNQAPLFQVSGPGQGFGRGGGGDQQGGPGGGQGNQRSSGRGGLTDPDIVQGRKAPATSPAVSEQDAVPPELRSQQLPPEMRPRVVLRFAAEKELLISGMLDGASELANKPAVIDIPVGKGHVVMFANNPMWRHQTHGSFSLLFNAALNFDHLNAGRTTPKRGSQPQTAQDK
ncbi:MAG: hypothetical protein J2P41_13905, partial [Blastocatellia bacterium]|nr:hypothetical protein [Blastocatellia bacterium]